MKTFDPIFFLSGARDSLTEKESQDRTTSLRYLLGDTGADVVACNGSYKGKAEPSLLVVARGDSAEGMRVLLLSFASLYEQESILAVDANRQARLVFTDGREDVPLGAFKPVSKAHAMRADAYTEFGGSYYVCE
jgi:hypothetical protein